MTTEQIRELMGAEATTAEAQAMERLLNGRNPADIADEDWFRLVGQAVETVSIKSEILRRYGAVAACDVPDHEFESDGLFGLLATAAGIVSPGARALVNGWNAWGVPVPELVTMFAAQ